MLGAFNTGMSRNDCTVEKINIRGGQVSAHTAYFSLFQHVARVR
jgi:hypothetical protein